MNRTQKSEIIDRMSAQLARSASFYVTDFTGIPVKRMTELRRKLRQAGSEYVVVKNTLALRALTAVSISGLEEMFRGPTGVVFAGVDPLAAAKILAEFQKEYELLTIKAGILEGQALSPQDVTRLATLPPREVLLAQLGGALQAPLQGFAGALSAFLAQMVGALEALRAQRTNE